MLEGSQVVVSRRSSSLIGADNEKVIRTPRAASKPRCILADVDECSRRQQGGTGERRVDSSSTTVGTDS